MKKVIFFLTAMIIIAFMNSCTMEKRLYLQGYNVEWNNSTITNEKIKFANNVTSSTEKQRIENNNLFSGKTDNPLNHVIAILKEDVVKQVETNNKHWTNNISQKINYGSALLTCCNNDKIFISKVNSRSNTIISGDPTNPKTKKKKALKNESRVISDKKSTTNDGSNATILAYLGFFLALVSAIVGLVLLATLVPPYITIVLSAIAAIISIVAKHKMSGSHDEIKGKHLAVFGTILGLIGFGVAALMTLALM